MGVPREQILIIARGPSSTTSAKWPSPTTSFANPESSTTMNAPSCASTAITATRCSKDSVLTEACDIVYSHQEHFDGSGYPRGLKGTEIPLGARIFSVADTLDAIISDRPYRPARLSPKLAKSPVLGRPPVRSRGRSGFPENARRHLRRPPPRNQRPELSLQLFRQRQRHLTRSNRNQRPDRSGAHDFSCPQRLGRHEFSRAVKNGRLMRFSSH